MRADPPALNNVAPEPAAPTLRLLLISDTSDAARGPLGNYLVRTCKSADDVRFMLRRFTFDVVVIAAVGDVLDQMRWVRQFSESVGLIVLGDPVSDSTCAALLDAGADDVIDVNTSPCVIDAKIRAVARRASGRPSIDFADSRTLRIDGLEVVLTRIQARLMRLLIAVDGRPVPADILKTAGMESPNASDEALNKHFERIRTKLRENSWRLTCDAAGAWFFDVRRRRDSAV